MKKILSSKPLFSVILFILPILPDLIQDWSGNGFSWELIINMNMVIGCLLALVPWYMAQIISHNKEEFEVLKNAFAKYEEAINKCPKMIALHTDENILEKKIDQMIKLDKPNQRWLMSKYISKLLTVSVSDFIIKINAADYSNFSSSLIRDCVDSVKLTGSMRPYDWLNALGSDENNKNLFFNSLLELGQLKIDANNHSIVLTQCNEIETRKRIVCFNDYDWKYLYLSEISIDEYFHINGSDYNINNLQTYFVNYTGSNFDPIKYEYALYDDAILLKWDKLNENLRIIVGKYATHNDLVEFNAVKEIFDNSNNVGGKRLYEYDKIKSEVSRQKIALIESIVESSKLPHKLAYLYKEGGINWIDYIEDEESIFSSVASDVMKMGIRSLIDEKIGSGNVKLVEIGPGDGSRSHVICDCFGSERIESYELIDISNYLLDKAHKNLELRLQNKIKRIQLDWTEEAERKKVYKSKNKIVLIPYNSTLFTEPEFDWNSLNNHRYAIISLDMYDEIYEKDIFNNYISAFKLLLHPLKIFEIPIDCDYIWKNRDKLFMANYDKVSHTYNVYFKLKNYVNVIQDKNVKRRYDKKYQVLRDKLKQIEDLLVMSSLKFDTYESAKSYFVNRGFEPIIKINGKYMIILLSKKHETQTHHINPSR